MRCVLQRPKGYAQAHKPKPVTPPVFAGTNTTAPPVIRDVISAGIEARGRGRWKHASNSSIDQGDGKRRSGHEAMFLLFAEFFVELF